eukprot:CAMPEP_0197441794 /NCGR_PEP_ID=MMETSP1175-20131217/7966_1 /TAXON_ID=1003142 /ORGANISM="Triceratium dubium, Strain CCMP147" /LENGTH=230 /DNA_ID=CAMNT_0042972125 /DNA_START=21 /DNA_END=713 /DNA_ORIENTATION=-
MVFFGICSACGEESDSLRRCQGVCSGAAAYCSRECQAKDWRGGHKKICGKVGAKQKVATHRDAVRRSEEGKNMHPFYNFEGTFHDDMAPYLAGDPELVEIEYTAPIKEAGRLEDKDGNFVRVRNIPLAAVERAQKDSTFDRRLSHSVALGYHDELVAACRANGVVCEQCGDEVSTIFQCPMTKIHPDRYSLVDIMAKPCCSKAKCMVKSRSEMFSFTDVVAKTIRDVQSK